MDTQNLQRKRERGENPEAAAASQKPKEDREGTSRKNLLPFSAPLPPSSTSSPAHEFSFTISLNHPNTTPNTIKCNKSTPSLAIDLAPADDIFFHGHLLPLHFLSHSPISPRSSDISINDLSLPIEHVDDTQNPKHHNHNFNINNNTSGEAKERSKPKSFTSLFGLKKWRKASDVGEKEEDDKKKRKSFDLSRILKKYVSLVEPLFSFKGDKEKGDLRRRPYSFSGNSNPKDREGWRRRRGQISAPASMRTSPTNSGLLLATSTNFSSSDESTMEELQNAIQAAIAHCKNSIANKEEKCKG